MEICGTEFKATNYSTRTTGIRQMNYLFLVHLTPLFAMARRHHRRHHGETCEAGDNRTGKINQPVSPKTLLGGGREVGLG